MVEQVTGFGREENVTKPTNFDKWPRTYELVRQKQLQYFLKTSF